MMKKNEILRIIRNFVPYGIMEKRKKREIQKKLEYLSKSDSPKIFNAKGDMYKYFFLKDDALGWQFYSYTRFQYPKQIFWDRTNPSLKKHFYGHNAIGKTLGKPDEKFAILVETEGICPDVYHKLLVNADLAKEYSLIFTHSEKILDKYPNARFIPAGGVWYGTTFFGGTVNPFLYKEKTKNISLVSSNKIMNHLHQVRYNLAMKLKESSLVDTFGTFDGGKYVRISETLEKYRYSIIIENTITKFCFTEKILNCFKSMTIPIYIGAQNIGEFFNKSGIIVVSEKDLINSFEDIISMCTEEYYQQHLGAVVDNFHRVKKYTCQEDYIIDQYMTELNL